MNRIVKDSIGAEAEIDVLVHRPNHEVVFIECKGIHPISTLDDAEVEKWLLKRIPVIRGLSKRTPNGLASAKGSSCGRAASFPKMRLRW